MRHKAFFCAAAVALGITSGPGLAQDYRVPSNAPEYIRAAVQSDERSDEMRARDSGRKPAEVLMLSGVEPGDHVIEFASIGLYYTTMLADIVGPDGKVGMYDLPYTEQFGGQAARDFVAAHPNAEYHLGDYGEVQFPDGIDVAFNVLYYHDLQPQGVDTAALNAKLFDALKPGGVYLVIDHKAEDGSGWRDASDRHRMGAETIVEEVTAAGFELAERSDLLAHPEDDRTAMVFSMRGATDRALFVFRKPE
jgi:predicted methyltransferase